jgi:thioredoxin reductase (NADPH)
MTEGGWTPRLSDRDIDRFRREGTSRQVVAGEYLYREGDLTYDFYVLLSAEVEIVVTVDGDQRVVMRFGSSHFLGEFNMLTGMRVFVSARVAAPGEVIAVHRDRLRRLMAADPVLGDTILAAFIARRTRLLDVAAETIRVIGSRYSPDTLRVREFLARTRIPHEWIDSDADPDIDHLLQQSSITAGDLPAVIANGSVIRNATPGVVASYLGLTAERLPERCFDLVVIGGGPAGLAAAVYGASEGLHTLGIEMTAPGGQAGASSRIENYLGFPRGITGAELTQAAVIQAEKFGAQLTTPCRATLLRSRGGYLVVELSDGTEVTGRAVVAATGAAYRRLEADRLSDFEGRGVYYAATELEARQCSGAPVLIVGGGNSAGQAAIFMAQRRCSVSIVIRGGDLRKSMSSYLVQRIESDPAITVRTATTIAALDGDETLRSVRMRTPDGDVVVPCGGIFSFIGADPASDWIAGCAALDEHGFVRTDASLTAEDLGEAWEHLDRAPLTFETSYPGLFAVGDVRSGSMKRVASAVGEGSASVRAVHQYLAFSS